MERIPLHLSGRRSVSPRSSSIGSITQQRKKSRIVSSSLEGSFSEKESSLPPIKLRKVMTKIGAADKNFSSFVPSNQDRLAFRKAKELELRQLFSNQKGKKHAFDYELDEIVLDCWDYKQNYGRRTIWKKYKQKFDELAFDTLKIIQKKKS